MFKKILAFVAAMYMAVSFAAVDVNKATAAELDGIKGIGPGISGRSSTSARKAASRTGTTSSNVSKAWVKAMPPSFPPKA